MFFRRPKPKPDAAAAYWSAKTSYPPNWFGFCAPYINERVTGDPNTPPTPWALSTLFSGFPIDSALEIGCTRATKLASMVRDGIFRRAHGTDIAAGAIEDARRDLLPTYGDRLTLSVGDLNRPALPERAFDVVLSNGVLHHIENLEACVAAIRRALKPGGWLIASEFTGPQRYAYSRREIRAINDGLALLPPEVRGRRFHPKQLQVKLDDDPSESIRTDIEPVLRNTFSKVRTIPYGGNVLMRALTKRFFRHYDPADEKHVEGVARLVAFDREVSAEMPSHHCFFMAQAG